MEKAIDNGTYILEEIELEVDNSSDDDYVAVSVEENVEKSLKEFQPFDKNVPADHQPSVTRYNEVVDDFVRNFLKTMKMTETLAVFQHEWYNVQRPNLFRDLSEEISDLKLRINQMESEKKKWQTVCDEVQQTWDRLKQERNFHREGLESLQKEKADLTEDLRKMKKTKKRLDPALQELQQKFEQVNKERSLLRIERDKLLGEIQKLQKDSGDGQAPKE